MTNLAEVSSKLNALLANLSPQARRTLARNIGRKLAQSQRNRISKQQNPDGSAFEPRKAQKLRQKQGRIKRKAMFVKLKGARFLKVKTNAQGVSVGFSGSSAKIAEIHQFGGSAEPRKNAGYKVQYAQRELLGFSERDLEMIEELVIEQLANS